MFGKLKKLLGQSGPSAQEQALERKKQGDALLGDNAYAAAADQYRQALALAPELPEIHIALGFVLSELGSGDEAAAHLRQALTLSPGNGDAHFMLGNLARERGDLRAAADHYAQAILGDPSLVFAYRGHYETLSELGESDKAREVLKKAVSACPESVFFPFELAGRYYAEKDFARAAPLLQRVLTLTPDNLDCHMNLALCYMGMGQEEAAIPSLEHVVSRTPDNADAQQTLGNAYLKVGKKSEALACYQTVLRLEPDNPLKHLVAAFSGMTTEVAPAKYVEELFDQYAETFDTHLVQSLRYQAPAFLRELLQAHRELSAARLDVLDLGCGTGLFGKEIAPYANRLVGVDLSSKMLEKAERLGVYQRLAHQDIVEMMRAEPEASYDLIAAADVFVYIGALDDIVREAKRLLRPNGLFTFSTESLDALPESVRTAGDFHLNETGRYAHALGYLTRLAEGSGLRVLATREATCREDKGKPIIGYVTLWLNESGA